MRTDAFDFDLPESAIALRPARPRDSARLLVVRPEGEPEIADCGVRDLVSALEPGDLLVLNDTRVIPARLDGVRDRGDGQVARIEATLIERQAGDRWAALARPGKRLKVGDVIAFGSEEPFSARVEAKEDGGEVVLAFDRSGPELDRAIALTGRIPLPPYIGNKRPDDEADRADYQTVFAREPGAVAAPTASLHLTEELIARLEAAGIGHVFLTLHVGAGTFLPVKSDTTEGHRMHAEYGHVSAAAAARINAARAAGGRIVAVGTTALRLLESAADEAGIVHPFSRATSIFITPGYRFRATDVLMTNFHLPRSTLFMLVCAFAGLDRMRRAYDHAIRSGYRFYSYGDGSLLFRDDAAAREFV